MTEHIYIGVDGGGTKSKLVIRDADGVLLGTGRSGASNIRLSVDKKHHLSHGCLSTSLYASVAKRDLSQAVSYWLSLAAFSEVPRYCTEFLAKIARF